MSNDVLIATVVLATLTGIFFADVIFANRTLVSSGFAYERIGVTGSSPPYGYTSDEPPGYNYYLMDPLPAAWSSEPIAEKAANVYGEFDVPLWDANQSMGQPLLATGNPNLVSPLRFPLVLFPQAEAWDAFLIARVFFAGLLTYLLARRLGLLPVAAVGAAVAFAFSGYFMLFVNMPNADAAMMTPVILFAFELLLARPRPTTIAIAAISVAVSIAANNPESAVLLVAFGATYYVARVIAREGLRDWRTIARTIPPLAISGITGAGLTAFYILPFLELTGALGGGGLSEHLHTADAGKGSTSAPLDQLISVFIPYFKGATWQSFEAGTWTGIRHYSGLVVVVLAVAAIWNRELMKAGGWFFLGSAMILTAKWFGVPIINEFGRLPVLNVISFTQYSPPIIALSVAMLAGIGLDHLARGNARWFHAAAGLAVVVGLLTWLVWLNRDVFDFVADKHLIKHVGFSLVLVGAAISVWLAVQFMRLPRTLAAAAIVSIIAFELFLPTLPSRGDVPLLPESPYEHDLPTSERPLRYDPFQKPEFVEFLESQDDAPFRIYGLDRLVHPNIATAYGLQDVRGYTATTVRRYIEYVRTFIDEDAGFRFTGRWPIFERGEGDQLVENPFFDLMNVRYVLSPRVLPVASDYDLAQQFALSEPSGSGGHRLDGFEINGAPEAVLFQAPPVESSYTFTPTEDSRFLLFRIGMDPIVWTPDRGDGATFVVRVRANGSEDTLFSQYIDPKNEPGDRRWHDNSVDLSTYLGEPITVVLSTTFGENGLWDWAGWGGLRLGPDENTPVRFSSQYRLVHQDDAVRVYENLDALPRAFLVSDVRTVESMEHALGELSDTSFNPAQTAVIEGSPPTEVLSMLDAGATTSASEVIFQEYSDNEVRLRVRTNEPALLVLTDTFYPGWKVTVDGEQETIYPANVAFRGVFIPAGEHMVEFSYSPATFKAGAAISLASIAVLISYAAFAAVRHRLRPRKRTISDDGTPSSDSPFDGQEPDE